MQPNSYKFERSKTIKAPISIIFNKVNDYKNWASFSPWIEQEPNATITFNTKTSGIDAGYSWNGKILGEGSMKTTAIENNKSIAQHLSFIKPFKSESSVSWSFEPTLEGTKVTWGMKGEKDFITKLFTTFSGSIESMTGPDYERGLAKLDSIVLVDMAKYSIKINGITEHPGTNYIYNKTSCKISEYDSKMQSALPAAIKYSIINKLTSNGAPFIIYKKWDEKTNEAEFSCCVPTKELSKLKIDSSIFSKKLNPFKALKTTVFGDYKNLKEAWETSIKHIETNKDMTLVENGKMLEVYLTNPSKTPNPAKWITEIYIEVK